MKPSSSLTRSLLCALGAFAVVLVPVRGAQIDPKAISYTLPENIQWQKGTTSDSASLLGDPSKPGLYIQLDQMASRQYEPASLSFDCPIHYGAFRHMVGRHGFYIRSQSYGSDESRKLRDRSAQ
jgi:hypothetical protein